MKTLYKITVALSCALTCISVSQAQELSKKIGDKPTLINASAALEVESTNKGVLISRIALTGTSDTSTIANGNVTSMLVYNTATVADITPGYYYWNGTKWNRVVASDNMPALVANSETTTTLAQNTTTGVITYTNEDATVATANVVSANALNALTIGTDGGAFISPASIASTVPDATTTVTGKVQLAGDLGGTGTTATAPKVGGLQGRPVSATAPASGQVLAYNGTSWTPTTPGLVSEADGVIGNEVTDVISGRGLQRAGTGTDVDPYKIGMVSGTTPGQTMQWNGTSWGLTTAGTGTVTSTTGIAPISVATGSTTPVISLDDAGVSNVKLAPDAVTTDKIQNGTVANVDLANGAGGIYKGSGALAGATTVAQGANTLTFNSTATNGFSVDGNTFSVDAANNRVGIGTTTPSVPLQVSGPVAGAVRIVDGTEGAGKFFTSDANGVGSWTEFRERQRTLVTGTGGTATTTCLYQDVAGTSITLPTGYWTVYISGSVVGTATGTLIYNPNYSPYFDVAITNSVGSVSYFDGNVRKVPLVNFDSIGGNEYGVSFLVRVVSASATFYVRASTCGTTTGATFNVSQFNAID